MPIGVVPLTRPPLCSIASAAETAAAVEASQVAAALDPTAGGGLVLSALGYHGEDALEPRMFAFMVHAPLRVPPETAAPAIWPLRASWKHVLVSCLPPLATSLFELRTPSSAQRPTWCSGLRAC